MNNLIEKPWGKEIVIEKNDKYMLKKLTMYEGKRCSLQYHNIKTETIFVLSGKLRIFIGTSGEICFSKVFYSGDSITIPPKTIHRMKAEEICEYLEASTPEIDDVVRLEDDYKRN